MMLEYGALKLKILNLSKPERRKVINSKKVCTLINISSSEKFFIRSHIEIEKKKQFEQRLVDRFVFCWVFTAEKKDRFCRKFRDLRI